MPRLPQAAVLDALDERESKAGRGARLVSLSPLLLLLPPPPPTEASEGDDSSADLREEKRCSAQRCLGTLSTGGNS